MAKNKWYWIEDDRVPSQAEIDWYTAMDEGRDPEITQDHLDEIGVTEVTAEELAEPKTPEEIAEDNAPENQPVEPDPDFTSEHNPYIDPITGEKKFQTREEWSASIADNEHIAEDNEQIAEDNAPVGSLITGSDKRRAYSRHKGQGATASKSALRRTVPKYKRLS